MNLYWPNIDPGVYSSGQFLEVLYSINSGVSGLNTLLTNLNTLKITNLGTGHGQIICTELRYRNGNIISEYSAINCASY
jgi:hypothetical protein